MEFFTEFGYIGLFVVAFLAATILPIGSEVVMVGLLINDFNPVIVVLIATLGNVLGSLVNYFIGFYGGDWLTQKVLTISPQKMQQAQQQFNRWGKWSLLFAWVPIIGDPLTVIAGALKINIWVFLILVTVGKFGRYCIVAIGALNIVV